MNQSKKERESKVLSNPMNPLNSGSKEDFETISKAILQSRDILLKEDQFIKELEQNLKLFQGSNVSVRSSATVEDSATISCAGLFCTSLNVSPNVESVSFQQELIRIFTHWKKSKKGCGCHSPLL